MGETEDKISPVDHLVLVSLCVLVIIGTHYPTLEKLGAQNITACENQCKQCELSDHWKLKNVFKKNKRGWRKKDKKIDWNTSFNN